MSFPLEQWFDITKPIDQYELNISVDQMRLYAVKDGLDPEHPECKAEYRKMRNAVKQHNLSFKK
jgi:hypothetical protein